MPLVVRFKSHNTISHLIEDLTVHRNNVWPGGKNETQGAMGNAEHAPGPWVVENNHGILWRQLAGTEDVDFVFRRTGQYSHGTLEKPMPSSSHPRRTC